MASEGDVFSSIKPWAVAPHCSEFAADDCRITRNQSERGSSLQEKHQKEHLAYELKRISFQKGDIQFQH
jgi:hypothetical protein